MQAIENQATAAPSSLDEVPADAVAVVAAYAGFFDRAKLAVCGKLMSQACAKVTIYDAAAPPAWLQQMPVCLTQPWYSTWTDGAYEGTDYGRYASRMSHIESGRFCVVKA